METTVKERLIEYLRFKEIGQNRFEALSGISKGYIHNLKYSPSPQILQKIFNAAPDLNRTWLMTGEGPMLNGEGEKKEGHGGGLPVFHDAMFGCSPSGFMGSLEKSQADDRMAVPGLVNDGRTFIVRAHGESMVNKANPEHSIPNGAYVVIQKSNLSTTQWGEVYALSTDDGCIIKRLYQSDKDGCVKCVSYNADEFPSFDLPTTEIHDIGLVKAVVTVNVRK